MIYCLNIKHYSNNIFLLIVLRNLIFQDQLRSNYKSTPFSIFKWNCHNMRCNFHFQVLITFISHRVLQIQLCNYNIYYYVKLQSNFQLKVYGDHLLCRQTKTMNCIPFDLLTISPMTKPFPCQHLSWVNLLSGWHKVFVFLRD